MQTYEFIVLIALFLGIIAIIVMMELRRRKELAQFAQLHKTLVACQASLQAIHSSSGELHEPLTACLTSLQAIHAENEAQTAALAQAFETAVVRFESALLQHQKAQEAASQSTATEIAEVMQSTSKQLLAEAQQTTIAIKTLQDSVEASVKF